MPSYVITGASRGLGREFVNQLSQSPDNTVFGLVRNKKTADKLVALGRRNVHILEANITDVKALKAAAQEVSKVTGGSLDVLINNAALYDEERNALNLDGYPEDREDLLEQDLLKHFHTNVIGVIHTTNAFLPLLRSGSGSVNNNNKQVITISSGVGDIPFTLSTGNRSGAPYSISKAAVNLAVAKYAAEYKDQGILFLAISPGMVSTKEWLDQPTEEELKKFEDMVVSFRKAYPDFAGPISPEESVKAVLGVIDKATIEDTGAFISHKGNQEWL
ncbi:hypothetical protein ACEPAG_8220 [Sanghuangporus baumii]